MTTSSIYFINYYVFIKALKRLQREGEGVKSPACSPCIPSFICDYRNISLVWNVNVIYVNVMLSNIIKVLV